VQHCCGVFDVFYAELACWAGVWHHHQHVAQREVFEVDEVDGLQQQQQQQQQQTQQQQ
jgi:hypothetical protein